ncbi:uncharacterized protein BO97DRAFT_407497 [Aspergillus homomorphus CBS 101889]|uniref:A-kinase anchor protein 7-like phosphoesterase domain-containing protein n=1 Tax=Aspergillus homomorphus (strain CBS 101889) TaxID=1450537 RepID=A0A395HQG6_ASPHC|nr:hypothetical protein BO97DRAFT_407497 [Aspergillus homomorphus CBS 101889]RAL09739.1 hypothetical protein BO97DRAFT_407497 [Aspergillus homomorphus CBS 101889]
MLVSRLSRSLASTNSLGHAHTRRRSFHQSPASLKFVPATHLLLIPVAESLTAFQKWSSGKGAFVSQVQKGSALDSRNFRAVGTLHMTVAAMHLTTEEHVRGACKFLKSLDIGAIMRRVEQEIIRQAEGYIPAEPTSEENPRFAPYREIRHQPLVVSSFESVGALPYPDKATTLFAFPVDPSRRLHLFMRSVRHMFMQAGFLKSDTEEIFTVDQPLQDQSSGSCSRSRSRISSSSAVEQPSEREFKWRASKVHVTIAGTNYFDESGRMVRRYVDVRDILSRFQDYYLDEEKTIPRCERMTFTSGSVEWDNFNTILKEEEEKERAGLEDRDVKPLPGLPSEPEAGPGSQSPIPAKPLPFVWARDIRLDSLQLVTATTEPCDPPIPNVRSNRRYRVIAETSLL